MLFDLFKKSKVRFISPAKGKLKSITEVDDEVFSTKSLGDGFAIEPETDEVFSPTDGTVAMVFPTGHAIGLRSDNGVEVLIHIGVDSVILKGEGFNVVVHENQKIKAGELIAKFDRKMIKDKIPSVDIITVFTSGETCELIKNGLQVNNGETDIVKIKSKG